MSGYTVSQGHKFLGEERSQLDSLPSLLNCLKMCFFFSWSLVSKMCLKNGSCCWVSKYLGRSEFLGVVF